MKNQNSLKWIIKNSKGEIPKIFILSISNILLALVATVLALVSKLAIDSAQRAATASSNAEFLHYRNLIIFNCILILVVITSRLLLRVFTQSLTIRVQAKMEMKMRGRLFYSIMMKDYGKINKYHSGELMNRITSDVKIVTEGIISIVPDALYFLTQFVGAFVVLIIFDWKFTMLFIVAGIVMSVIAVFFRGKLKNLSKQVQETDGKVRSFFQEAIESMLVVKTFGLEKQFDKKGNICSVAQKEFEQIYPKPGWVEHDPMEIWASQLSVATEAISKIGASADEIASIGITNQRETTVVWNRETGMPIYNAIVWQCRRTAERIDQLKEDGLTDYVKETTGLIPDAYFSASKVAWILDHVEGARKQAENGDLAFGTIDTWLIWNLTRGEVHATDYTNASRTMMFDIHKLDWDQKILDYFKIPKNMLPKVKPSSGIFGYTEVGMFGESIPIAGAAGDQQSALFGQCCFDAGEVKNTYGTGCFLLMNTGEKAVTSENGLLTTIAASADGTVQYALEGSIFVAGAAIQWLRDEMRMIRKAADTERYATAVEDTAGVYLVPAFTGIGAPYWDPYARGTVVGITRGCKKEHFIRAALESMAYQTNDILKVMEEESGVQIRTLKVDGGASNNNFLMQFQSDILGVDVLRPQCVETTALGAAYLAGIAVGYWEDVEDVRANWALSRTFHADMSDEKRQHLLKGWKKAVGRAFEWVED